MHIGWGNVQHVPGQQRTPGVAAELPEGEGGLAAEIIGNVEAAAHCQIGATAMIHEFSELKYRRRPSPAALAIAPAARRPDVRPCGAPHTATTLSQLKRSVGPPA